ncbi:MAG: MFS transporter [Candidatus Dormibacteria bacterium]
MSNSGAWSRVIAPLRDRDFRLVWSGSLVSRLGDGVFTVAVALEALRVDHQPTGLAFVLAARAVPSVLLSILGGVVVDRIPRRTTMLVADLVQGTAVGVIGILVFLGQITLWQLVLMAIVFGAADAFSGPASTALLPELLPKEAITQANALNSTSSELCVNLIGPAAGGLAVGVIGTAAAFGFDAALWSRQPAYSRWLIERARPRVVSHFWRRRGRGSITSLPGAGSSSC